MSKKMMIVEVGPRDGLQNETAVLSHAVRLEFARRLAEAGVKKIELGAFVSPQWVPQMAGSSELLQQALKLHATSDSPLRNTEISALVPNPRGMADALKVGMKNVAIFGSASESFSKKNINCTIEESMIRFQKVIDMASAAPGTKVRGYLSMCFGCPFEGDISEGQVVRLVKRMIHMGIYEVSIGDTIGVANPLQVKRLVTKLIDAVGADRLAMHFHDTRGTALANVLASVELGIRVFDSSLGGLGGCPYAPSATGNVATEDLVYMLHGMGYDTGIDLPALLKINPWMAENIGHRLSSRVGRAGLPRTIPI